MEDRFIYSGKSYILEGIRARWDISKEQITQEIRTRAEILEWMKDTNVRTFQEVAKAISRYIDSPDEFMKKIRSTKNQTLKSEKENNEIEQELDKLDEKEEKLEENPIQNKLK